LETQYQKLLYEQEHLKTLPNKTKFKESQWAMLDVTNQIQQGKQGAFGFRDSLLL
jgi:hypothetical protein